MTIIAFLAAARKAEGLSKCARAVLLGLLTFIDGQDGTAFPSIRTLQRASGWGRRSVQNGLGELVRRGVVTVLAGERGGIARGGRGITKRVQINLNVLRAMGASDAPIKGARRDAEGRTRCTRRVHATTPKGAPGAPKQDMKGTEKRTGEGTLTLDDEWGLQEALGKEVPDDSR